MPKAFSSVGQKQISLVCPHSMSTSWAQPLRPIPTNPYAVQAVTVTVLGRCANPKFSHYTVRSLYLHLEGSERCEHAYRWRSTVNVYYVQVVH
jgi:hypothetical protein